MISTTVDERLPLASVASRRDGDNRQTATAVRNRQRWLRRLAWRSSAVVAIVLLAAWTFGNRGGFEREELELYTAVVERGRLPITVLARGELESSQSEDVHCEVDGSQIKIVKILPEGSAVKKGDLVIEFDTKELDILIAERTKSQNMAINAAAAARKEIDVEKNRCDSMISRGERDLQRALMNRDKYLDPKGEYQVEVDDLKAAIAEIERDLVLAREKLGLYNKSYKRGFSSAEQVRAKEQDVERLERRLDRDRAKLHLLENFTRKQQEAELNAQAVDAALELERTKHNCEIAIARAEANAKSAADVVKMEREALERLNRQRDLCTVPAPHDGILVYAKDSDFDSGSQIKQGAVVYHNQKLFSLPDLNQMQVNVKIHESKVKRIAVGQTAEIRIDGYPLLHGTVIRKASLPDSNGFMSISGVKEYVSVVRIDDLAPDVKLLPRMSAEVTILVGEVPDTLLVPLQAVTESSGQYYSCVVVSNGVEPRRVDVGENNDKYIEILGGVRAGERVTLDARARLVAELMENNGTLPGEADAPVEEFNVLSDLPAELAESISQMESGNPPSDVFVQPPAPDVGNEGPRLPGANQSFEPTPELEQP